MATAILSAARLRELLHYCPETGVFLWKVWRGGPAVAGSVAGGTDSKGYRQIKLDMRLYLAHRLAWLYVHGEFPSGHLDHVDRNPQNNSIANLRQCTHAENHQNTGVRADNTSGVTGVSFNKESAKWLAYINKGGRKHRLGLFETLEEAVAVRVAAKSEVHTFHPFQQAFGAERGVSVANFASNVAKKATDQ